MNLYTAENIINSNKMQFSIQLNLFFREYVQKSRENSRIVPKKIKIILKSEKF